tara:strand:- start:214 stop:1296 length:1083 start_codon:yes stop_codon:yes gene_type:complete
MKNNKTAFVTFFPIKPDTMGSSAVVNSRFTNWPNYKKIFHISHLGKINNSKIETIHIKKETPINKILKLPEIILKIQNYLKNSKKKTIVIEGASWIFYSFVVLIFFKLFNSTVRVIYISHSIEAEIRKKYSNIIIYFLTRYLEGLVFKYSDISTSVSQREKRVIKSLYNIDTILLPNGISLRKFKLKNKLKINYIIYTGSYSYKPNKDAIDYLNNHIMPELIKKIPNLKLVLTGGGFYKKFPWIINKGIISKDLLNNLIFFSKCLCVPLKFGSGTRIKIIEALCLGAVVISTKKGIEGIKLKSINPPFIEEKKTRFVRKILQIIHKNKKIKSKSINLKKYYLKKYSMKNIISEFIKKNEI